jgi:hypothetical protein
MNYGLIKPLDNETADIAVVNENMDMIDDHMKQNADAVAAHLAENMIHTAGGTANAVVVTTGGDFYYIHGAYLKFKAIADNTGNMTMNIDGKGVRTLKKLDGSQIPAGGIKNGKVYEVYYDAGGDCFFLLARAEGDAVADDVLAGKTFSNGNDIGIIGTMPNQGQKIITPGTANVVIPVGYHDGTGYAQGDADLVIGNIRAGVSIFGVNGKSSVVDVADTTMDVNANQLLTGYYAYNANGIRKAGTMPNSTQNITPWTANITIPAGYHSGAGVVYGDTNLVSGNIKKSVSIFGVTGSLLERFAKTGVLFFENNYNILFVSGYNSGGNWLWDSYTLRINPSGPNLEVGVVTDQPVDLTGVTYIRGEMSTDNNASGYLVVSTSKDGGIDVSDARTGLSKLTRFALYVGSLSGPYYIRFHARGGSLSQNRWVDIKSAIFM